MNETRLEVPDNDETHPIPHLGKIDVAVNVRNGGYYSIVVSRPLVNDEVTRERLIRKLDNYLNDFYSPGFSETNGVPMEGKLRIFVRLHAEAAPGILAFLEACRPWLADKKVQLEIQRLPPAGN